jgi:homoserine O-succinyltransferase/O-acetyltransferase
MMMALPSSHPHRREPPRHSGGREPVVIGLVNNMPDAALRTTELQIRDLLARAAGELPVSLRIFSLPELPRSEAGRLHVGQYHEPVAALWTSQVDALIVTGTEPKAVTLEDEPYWRTLTRLVDWAEDHTISTIWSCLAAHGAAHYLDGIERQPLNGKLFGVFECDRATDHPLVDGGPPEWCVPHSRYNELPEQALVRAGYRILTRSPEVGADMFVKERKSLFLFLQGHPEYDSTALFGEYRRDIRRFLAGESNCYPDLPQGYFNRDTAEAMVVFRERALRQRDIALLPSFPAAAAGRQLAAPWRSAATCLYANWLSYVVERRGARVGWPTPGQTAVVHESDPLRWPEPSQV